MKEINSREVASSYYTKLIKILEEIIDTGEEEDLSTINASKKANYVLENIISNTDNNFGLYPEIHLKSTQLLLDTLVDIRDNYDSYNILEIVEKAKNTLRNVGYEDEYPLEK